MVKQFVLLAVEACLILLVLSGLYLFFVVIGENPKIKPKPIVKEHFDVSGLEAAKEEFVYFVATQLGIYKGQVEIVEMVTLDTRDITGKDYILITLRAPDGKLYQTVISRGREPWSQWEFHPETFIPMEQVPFNLEVTPRIEELVPRGMFEYYKLSTALGKHPATAESDRLARSEVRFELPNTLDLQTVTYTLELDKNKPLRFVPTLKQEATALLNDYWKVDYPAAYSGSGYRAYLFKKIKGE